MQPDVTIIIPIHNSEKYVVQCVTSAMQQTHKNIEIICVGGSGEDHSENMVEDYRKTDNRVRLIRDKNGSYGHKINVGVQNAKGKYISILESDDSLPQDAIQILLEPTQTEEYDYVDGDYVDTFDLMGQTYFYPVQKYKDPLCKDKKLEGAAAIKSGLESARTANWTAVYRKDFLIQNDIWHHESPGASYQDTSFRFLVVSMAKKTYHISKEVYQYRIDNENSSVKSSSKVFAIKEEYEYIKHFLQTKKCDNQEIWDYYYVWKYKDYYWNLCRLSDEKRKEFLTVYVSELKKDIKNWSNYDKYVTEEKVRYLVLPLGDTDELFCQIDAEDTPSVFERVRDIIHHAADKEMVIVGCGIRGHRLLNIFSKREGLFACDNNVSTGEKYSGIPIESIKKTVEEHREAMYVISSQKYFEELKNQLLAMGISQNQIIAF